ncbi:hypothetical protein [Streptomyces scabiei]|uniref:hypothetical protein n=1 Tax=Streptomyces scabiei TaxID=1930 RepID=UPI0029BEBE71|nr:hypothetical protein [Streptomyces scabiei]MDX3200124.1 hypothetical protein [Streptomyces scabiei]
MSTRVRAPVRAPGRQPRAEQPYADEEGPDEEGGHRERDQGHGEGAPGGRIVARVVAAAGLGDREAAAEALEEAREGEGETVAEADEVLLARAVALAVRRDGQGDGRDQEEPDRPERGQGRTRPVAPEGPAEEGADGRGTGGDLSLIPFSDPTKGTPTC